MRSVHAKLLCLLLVLLTAVTPAMAEIAWPDAATTGQQLLQAYIGRVNANLTSLGASPVNSLFEVYATGAALGVTAADDAEIPEGVEINVTMYQDSLNTLQLRVNQPEQFAALAASCIQAASPTAVTLQEALTDPTVYVKQVQAAPTNSFEDTVTALNGPSPRTYYAYYPNQYRDGVSWLQLTLVFAMAGAEDAAVSATETPGPTVEPSEYEGYNPADDLTHFEIFTTATPEPFIDAE